MLLVLVSSDIFMLSLTIKKGKKNSCHSLSKNSALLHIVKIKLLDIFYKKNWGIQGFVDEKSLWIELIPPFHMKMSLHTTLCKRLVFFIYVLFYFSVFCSGLNFFVKRKCVLCGFVENKNLYGRYIKKCDWFVSPNG